MLIPEQGQHFARRWVLAKASNGVESNCISDLSTIFLRVLRTPKITLKVLWDTNSLQDQNILTWG